MLRFGAPGRQILLLDYPVDPRPRTDMRALAPMFATGISAYKRTLTTIVEATESLGRDRLPWTNPFLPPLDAASLYGLVRSRGPRLYLEIGSGNSTIFARRAIVDSASDTRIISIDPYPREEIDTLCDEVIRKPLQRVDMSLFHNLSSGDILFFDGTHQSFPNSDVTVFFMEILPSLAARVIVGIHDIYLPDDYPAWAASTFPNEQYLLGSWLLGRGNMDVVLLPCWFVHRYTDLGKLLTPLWARIGDPRQHGGAFWFEVPPTH
jgi:hypothetical protein